MAIYGIGVGLAQAAGYYNSIEASWAFAGGNGEIGYNVVQRTILDVNGNEVDRHDISGPCSLKDGDKSRNKWVDLGYPSPGTRKSAQVQISTSLLVSSTGKDFGGEDFQATIKQTHYTWWVPKLNTNNFKLATGTSTSRIINFSSLEVPQGERLSWENANGGFVCTNNGVTSGNYTVTGMAINTRYSLTVGMVPPGSGGPYIPGASGKIDVYPNYTSITKGSITAERNTVTPSTVQVTWGAFSGYPPGLNWTASIQILDAGTSTVLKTQSINSTIASNTSVTGLPLDKNLTVRIMVTGAYHDKTTKTEYSTAVTLGYLNNTYVKVGGVWKRGIRTYVKVGGTWRANNGLVRRKENGGWK